MTPYREAMERIEARARDKRMIENEKTTRMGFFFLFIAFCVFCVTIGSCDAARLREQQNTNRACIEAGRCVGSYDHCVPCECVEE